MENYFPRLSWTLPLTFFFFCVFLSWYSTIHWCRRVGCHETTYSYNYSRNTDTYLNCFLCISIVVFNIEIFTADQCSKIVREWQTMYHIHSNSPSNFRIFRSYYECVFSNDHWTLSIIYFHFKLNIHLRESWALSEHFYRGGDKAVTKTTIIFWEWHEIRLRNLNPFSDIL